MRPIRFLAFLVILAAISILGLALFQPNPQALAATDIRTTGTPQPPQGYIVKFRQGVSGKSSVASLGITAIREDHFDDADYALISSQQASLLSANPNVEWIEPNYIRELYDSVSGGPETPEPTGTPTITPTVTITATPTATAPPPPSYFSNVNKVDADLAHNNGYRGNSRIIIGVVDFGAYNHPLFSQQLLTGYNFIRNNTDTNDEDGHGTHVMGIAHNMCPNCSLLPLKGFSYSGGGDDYTLARAIRASSAYGVNVLNLSWGGSSPSQTLCDAISYVQQKGVIVVVSAGNSASSNLGRPATCKDVVVVSAVDDKDVPVWWSNYGSLVKLAAPGWYVLSSVPPIDWFYNQYYYTMSGTSMAAPAVAGAVGLLESHTSLQPAAVVARLIQTAVDISTGPYDNVYGKRLDIAAALGMQPRPVVVGLEAEDPLYPPTGGVAHISAIVRQGTSVVLGVSPPWPMLSYSVVMIPCNERFCGTFQVEANTSQTDQTYWFYVTAVNQAGSAYSYWKQVVVQAATNPNPVHTPTPTPTPSQSAPVITSVTIANSRVLIQGENFLANGIPVSQMFVMVVHQNGGSWAVTPYDLGVSWEQRAISFALPSDPSVINGKIYVVVGNISSNGYQYLAVTPTPVVYKIYFPIMEK